MQIHSLRGMCDLQASPLAHFFKRQSRLRIDCKCFLQTPLHIFHRSLPSRVLPTTSAVENSTVRHQVETIELQNAISQSLAELRQSQRVHMPGLGPILNEMGDDETTEGSFKLFLPSELSMEDRDAWCPPYIPALEFRFRYTQADDSLAELRRLLRLFRNLRDENSKHLSLAQRAVTRTKRLFDSFQTRIHRSANCYSHARSAMLALDPDQKFNPGWMEQFEKLNDNDIHGPGCEPDDTSEGQFKPSWIWLVPRLSHPPLPVTTPSGDHTVTTTSVIEPTGVKDAELTDSMRAHWARCQARAERYEEEIALTLEEMGRPLQYFEWKRSWWLSLRSEREESELPPPAAVRHGLRAYAYRQANVYDTLVHLFANQWRKTLVSHKLYPTWLSRYPATGDPQDHSQPMTNPNPAQTAHKPSPSRPSQNDGMEISDTDNDDYGDDGDNGDDDEYVFNDAEMFEFDLEDKFTV